jgi:hypothetical protein
MNTVADIHADRTLYAEHAQQFWVLLKTDGSDRANLESERAGRIAERWARDQRVGELLRPLLSHEDEAVRYAAAADLLTYERCNEAIQVLRDIVQKSSSLVGPTARLALMKRGIPRT